jgi:hypothetical protein
MNIVLIDFKKLWHQRKHKIQFSLSNIFINKKVSRKCSINFY